MARRRPTSEKKPEAKKPREPKASTVGVVPAGRLTAYELDARPLVTLGPDLELWTGGKFGTKLDGTIVRLQPPADATEARIEEVADLVRAGGSVAVKVLPRLQIGNVGGQAAPEEPAVKPVGLREAVMETAARMASSDKAALEAELNSVMDEVGL